VPLTIPAGEASKSWDVLIGLIDRLLELGVERDNALIALGGGVVGDLTGFAASILKRGCRLVQVPTTLLAQVDSSVGGKTAINTKAGKNLVGTFHQPAAVFIDPAVLGTLPDRQVRAGYAEIVKYGLIADPDFFDWCEAHASKLIAGDIGARTFAIAASVRAKAGIVGRDEHERSGERALLNFGHTFGHALEAETGFGDALLHGEAVALGMILAYRFSLDRGLCHPRTVSRVTKHFLFCGHPTELSKLDLEVTGAELAEHIRHDKKVSGGSAKLILSREIGDAFVEAVELSEIADFLDFELGREAPPHAALR